MRLSARATTLGAAVLLAGLSALAGAPSEAADLSDDVLKALVEQDAKQIEKQLNEGKPKAKSLIPIKSSAMMIAAYAQNQITGKNADQDAKYATLRENALKILGLMKEKKHDEALKVAPALSLNTPANPKADTKKLELHTLHGFDINELMGQYRKVDPKDGFGGLNIELDIKTFARKGGAKPEQAAAIAARSLITADLVEKMEPDMGFVGGKKTKAAWEEWNKKMRAAAQELAEISKAPKADPKKLKDGFSKLDNACVGCHDIFKTM